MCSNISIYNKFIELDNPIDTMNIYEVPYCPNLFSSSTLYVEMSFMDGNDFINFKNIIREQMNKNIEILRANQMVKLNSKFPCENYVLRLTLETDTLTNFPTHVNKMYIESRICLINLINLPKKLLKIGLKFYNTIDISIFHTLKHLDEIDLSESLCKFNLDNFPDDLKILRLNKEKLSFLIYKIEEFERLPKNLTLIYIYNQIYNSIEELVKNYEKN